MHIIKFLGDDVFVGVTDSGVKVTAIKPICDNLGLDYEKQWKKIRDGRIDYYDTIAEASDGTMLRLFCIAVDQLRQWLYAVRADELPAENRLKLYSYRQEATEELTRHQVPKTDSSINLTKVLDNQFYSSRIRA